MLRHALVAILVTTATFVGGCAATSSSTPASNQQAVAYTGRVFVSDSRPPDSVKFKVLGSVEANARSGYDSATALYPLLADEARKLGANAVIGVTGGRRVTALSWSAAKVNGIAIRIDDAEALKKLPGTYH